MHSLQDYYHPYGHYYGLYHPAEAIIPPAPHYANLHLVRFGLFPRVLIYQALSSIPEEQFDAVQAIVRIVRDAPHEHLLQLIPHMDEFLSVFISPLLLDGNSNFKVILWTLDIIELLSERLMHRLHPYLSQIVLLLSRRLGKFKVIRFEPNSKTKPNQTKLLFFLFKVITVS